MNRLWATLRGARRATRVSNAEAVVSLQGAPIPFVFCFSCRKVIPSRPCAACDKETEYFEVTSETDRRLAVNRLAAEGDPN